MGTKKKYAQQLLGILYPKPTDDAKLDIQTAMTAIGQARDYYVKYRILQDKVETNKVYGNWLSTFDNVAIAYDDNRSQYYSTLPVGVIGLPNDQGVYHVFFKNSPENIFIPVSPAMKSIYRGSVAQYLEGEYGYYLLENRLYYLQKMDVQKTVSMNLVAESDQLGELDYFPIDASCLPDILKMAIEIYGVQKAYTEDLTNNGISE